MTLHHSNTQFALFQTVFLRLSSPSLAKSSMSELSAFEDVQNPEILPLLHSSFLKICSTMRLRRSSWRWATSLTVKPAKTSSQENAPSSILQMAKFASKALQKKNQKNMNITSKHGVFGIKWKLRHRGMRWAHAVYPGESRFPARANQRWSYIHGCIALSEGFFFQGALHDNGLIKTDQLIKRSTDIKRWPAYTYFISI